MGRLRSLLIALLAVVVILWAITPMARAMVLLMNTQHTMQAPPRVDGIRAVSVSFPTNGEEDPNNQSDLNPIPISGWMVLKNPNAPTVILIPGWKDDRASMLPYADFLVHAGLNVLLMDLRGTGHSGGSFSLGLHEPDDVEAMVSYLDQFGTLVNHHYGVLGVSFGAGVAVAAAGGNGKSYPNTPEIRAIVADSSPADEQPVIDHLNSLKIFNLSIPFPPLADTAIEHTLGGAPDSRSPLDGAENLTTGQALLLIHSIHDDDSTTPASAALALQQAAKQHGVPTTVWMAPLGGHGAAFSAQPTAYKQKVLAFFTTYLVKIKDPVPTQPATAPTSHSFGH